MLSVLISNNIITYMFWRPAPLAPPPMVWSPPGGADGAGAAVGMHSALRRALRLQWECPWRPRGRWGCSGDASSDGSRLLTYAICSNPWFSKHSFHEYCNLQACVVHCTALHCTANYTIYGNYVSLTHRFGQITYVDELAQG